MTPSSRQNARIAIVGAGLAGLACADRLRRSGIEVACFDKGRRPGGRLATRETPSGDFDHGAQYFTVRSDAFASTVRDWERDGVVAEWKADVVRIESGRIERRSDPTKRWVGVPGMNRIASHLAECIAPVRAEIVGLEPGDAWQLNIAAGPSFGPFDLVVLAMPPPQIVRLLGAGPPFAERLAGVRMAASIALMVSWSEPLGLPFDAAFVQESPLSWVARNSSKPGRTGENWVLHGGPEWSRDHLEDTDDAITRALHTAFAEAVGEDPGAPAHSAVHRWRAAAPVEPWPDPWVLDETVGLAACGDWCAGPRVEGAWRSGIALAERLVGVRGA